MVTECSALTRWRSREGSTCSSLARARTEASSIPVTVPPAAVRRPTATATASSSSSSSGGSAAPGAEPVAARGARRGVHRVAEARAVSVDVAAHGPRAHLRRSARSVPGQSRRRLQQRQQAQQPRRGLQHGPMSLPPICGQDLTAYDLGTRSMSETTTRHLTARSARSASTSPRPTSTTCATGWPAPAGRTSCPAPAGRPASRWAT